MFTQSYKMQPMGGGPTETKNFDEYHSIEARNMSHDMSIATEFDGGKGIDRAAALELVNKWNNQSIRYKYFI